MSDNASLPATSESRLIAEHPTETQSGISPSGALWMAFINLLWGAASVSAVSALAVFGPFSLAAMRFVPAGIILYLLAKRQSKIRIAPQDRLSFFLLGAFGIFFTYSIFYAGVDRTTASDASLLLACEPLLIALVARVFLKEMLSVRQWMGLLVGLSGVYLIAGQALGNQIALIGLCCECGVSVVAKRLTAKYPGLLVIAIEMLIGAALLLPFAIGEFWRHRPVPDSAAIAGVLYLTIVCSLFCYGAWFRLMERYPISAMGAFILLQPMIGPIFGWLLRGETLRPASAAGGLLVIAGIILTTLLPTPKTSTPYEPYEP